MTFIFTVHPADKNLTAQVTVAVNFGVWEVVPGTDLDWNTKQAHIFVFLLCYVNQIKWHLQSYHQFK
jgi:hypothetical protein